VQSRCVHEQNKSLLDQASSSSQAQTAGHSSSGALQEVLQRQRETSASRNAEQFSLVRTPTPSTIKLMTENPKKADWEISE